MDSIQKHKNNLNKYLCIGLILFVLILDTTVFAVGTGAMQISFGESLHILYKKLTNSSLNILFALALSPTAFAFGFAFLSGKSTLFKNVFQVKAEIIVNKGFFIQNILKK